LSLLYALLVILPLVFIIRNFFIFRARRKDFLYKVIVLKAIHELKKTSTKTIIKKYISKKIVVENEIKMFVLRNFSIILSSLQERNQPLVGKRNNYYLTKEGLYVLRYFTKDEKEKKIEEIKEDLIDPDNLEVWTEKELEKIHKS